MVLALVLLTVLSAGLLALGPSLETSEATGGPLPQPIGAPVATVTVEALVGAKFSGSDYEAKAGVVDFELTGATGHTLQFRGLAYEGFPLSTSGGPTKGKVRLAPGTYHIYCTVTGHAAQGMVATITVEE
jgi:plastocyanin